MMGLSVYRPRCCGCGGISIGRICYAGNNDKVVDNPYCGKCFGEVFKQTKKLITAAHEGTPLSSCALIQSFQHNPMPPSMPFTVAQLLVEGKSI